MGALSGEFELLRITGVSGSCCAPGGMREFAFELVFSNGRAEDGSDTIIKTEDLIRDLGVILIPEEDAERIEAGDVVLCRTNASQFFIRREDDALRANSVEVFKDGRLAASDAFPANYDFGDLNNELDSLAGGKKVGEGELFDSLPEARFENGADLEGFVAALQWFCTYQDWYVAKYETDFDR